MRPKRPASLAGNSHPSSSSSPSLSGGRASGPHPPSAATPDGSSSSSGGPGTTKLPSKTLPLSSVVYTADSRSPIPNKRPKPSPPFAAATSRRSDRKRKPRELFAATADASDGGGWTTGSRRSHYQQQQSVKKKVWGETDELVLLKAAIAFRSRKGELPRQATIGAFFDSVKAGISPHITLEQVGYKLRRLKSKYVRSLDAGSPSAGGATAHERLVNKLSSLLWAEEAKKSDKGPGKEGQEMEADAANRVDDGVATDEEGEEEEEDVEEKAGASGHDEYPFIKEAAENHWKGLGNYNAFVSNGLKLINPSKGKVLEEKVRKQCEAETLLLMKRLDLLKELSQMLVEANRSSRF